MIIRKRKLKISENHTQETLVRINKKYEKRNDKVVFIPNANDKQEWD